MSSDAYRDVFYFAIFCPPPLIKTGTQLTSHCQGDVLVGVPSGVTPVLALVLEVHPGQKKRCVAPRDLVREQGRPPLVERVLVPQLVLVLVVGVDLNLPILSEPVEDCVALWLEAARQQTAPPKHTDHLGCWRSENSFGIGGIIFIHFIAMCVSNTVTMIPVYKLLLVNDLELLIKCEVIFVLHVCVNSAAKYPALQTNKY